MKYRQPNAVATQKLRGVAVSEEDLRLKFGVEERTRKATLPDSYRKLFGLEPEHLIGFFDVQIGTSDILTQVNFVVTPSMIEHRLRRLQKIINRAKELIESWDVGVMKIRRGRDNVLDKPTRERFKRKERMRLNRCYVKREKYRAAKGMCVEKVWRETPIRLRDVVDDCMIFTPVLKTEWIESTGNVIETVQHGEFDVLRYKRMMSLGFDALSELGETHEERRESWANLQRWENAVIAAAVRYGVIEPRYDLARFLGLDKVLTDLSSQVEMEDFEQRDMDPEDQLAIKTGGRCYGGRVRIQSEGYRYRVNGSPVARALSSFDKPTSMGVRRTASR